ncbi:Transcriptional regulatory protein YehT [Kordia antarctica]|uniref:Transcriptional regulatory protein YehT n=1 Tax=Kordia antarctica TaxID=1218801 RepID=A0A7L4ZKC3_9FLAO|nr:LytTR family DNA-binding domain-containing protein [Kordia antarctica]QHI36666.1 Transcriptional regulatory protein YehT [Kordia antarctica]
MINAIIIEDEKSSMEYLQSILKRNHPNITILGWATNVDDAVKMIEAETPDILFMDIELLDGSGFDVLDRLKGNMTFEVIFTTGFLDYKERAMDYFAFYYLNKPIQEDEIKKVLDMYVLKRSAFDIKKYQAFKNQIKAKNQVLTIIINKEYVPIKISDILYCEASGSYTFVHTVQGDQFLSAKNLKRIESFIEDDSFFRVHRSVLVNAKHVKGVTINGAVRMSNDAEILISVRNRKKVLSMFESYKGTT